VGTAWWSCARLLCRGAHRAQRLFLPASPGLVILLFHDRQRAQVVDVAARVATGGGGPLADPAVVQADAGVAGQAAGGVGRRGAALGMEGVGGEPPRADDVGSSQLSAAAADARLVAVQHQRLAPRRLEGDFPWLDAACCLLHPAHQRAARQLYPQQVGQQVLRASKGHEVRLHQIPRQRTQPRPVLRPTGCLHREDADAHRLAGPTAQVHVPACAGNVRLARFSAGFRCWRH
jgi:hypothetical protein